MEGQNMKHRTWIALILVCLLAVGLAGCGGSSSYPMTAASGASA